MVWGCSSHSGQVQDVLRGLVRVAVSDGIADKDPRGPGRLCKRVMRVAGCSRCRHGEKGKRVGVEWVLS